MTKPNKALILAAGMGIRLLENTKEIPKCLIKVNDKAILEYQLEAIVDNGIRNIIIVVGYKAEKVREFINSNKKFNGLNIKFIENKEYAESNSSYSFWLAKDEVKDEPYLHFNCDLIFSSELLKEVIESKYSNLIVIDKKIKLGDKMELVRLKEDRIIKMHNMYYECAEGKGVGVAKFSPENVKWIIDRIEYYLAKGDKNQNYYGIIRQAVHYKDFFGLDAKDNVLFEINTVEDLEKTKKLLKEEG